MRATVPAGEDAERPDRSWTPAVSSDNRKAQLHHDAQGTCDRSPLSYCVVVFDCCEKRTDSRDDGQPIEFRNKPHAETRRREASHRDRTLAEGALPDPGVDQNGA